MTGRPPLSDVATCYVKLVKAD